MVYMLGSDMEEQSEAASNDILEMLRSKSDQSAHVYIMTGGSHNWALREALDNGTTAMTVNDGAIEVIHSEVGGTVATTDALEGFIRLCDTHTPSDVNYLILWGHGCEGTLGVGYDSLREDDTLTLSEICQAIENSAVSIDILGFDACGMATEPVVRVLSGCCKHLLASEQTIDLNGWPYRQIIDELTGDPDTDSRCICDRVAQNTTRTGEGFLLQQLF